MLGGWHHYPFAAERGEPSHYLVEGGQRNLDRFQIWRDIDRLTNLFREEQVVTRGVVRSEVNIPIRTELWEDLVRRRADETLTDMDGRPLVNRLSEAGFEEPGVWQTDDHRRRRPLVPRGYEHKFT